MQKLSVHSGVKSLVKDFQNEIDVQNGDINPRKIIQQQFITPEMRTDMFELGPLDFDPICSVKSPEAISAINRATTQKCKEEIVNISCLMQTNKLYPRKLPRYCHLRGKLSRAPSNLLHSS